jgi:adenylyltransferase/sulfurtransferase
MNEIEVTELKSLFDSGEDFQLVDVREVFEFEEANLGGVLIPLATILDSANKISKDKKVVIHCRSGARSQTAIKTLIKERGYENLYNLKGGIMAWINTYGKERIESN